MTKTGFEVAVVGDRRRGSPTLNDTPGDWFCLVRDGSVLKTPGGQPVAHPKRGLIDAIAREGRGRKGLSSAR